MQPEIHALFESKKCQDPADPGALPPNIGNLIDTDAEHKHHYDL